MGIDKLDLHSIWRSKRLKIANTVKQGWRSDATWPKT